MVRTFTASALGFSPGRGTKICKLQCGTAKKKGRRREASFKLGAESLETAWKGEIYLSPCLSGRVLGIKGSSEWCLKCITGVQCLKVL